MFASAIPFDRILIFLSKAWSLPLESNVMGSTLMVGSYLDSNVRLGWRWKAVTNDLAYYDTVVKSFIVQAPAVYKLLPYSQILD